MASALLVGRLPGVVLAPDAVLAFIQMVRILAVDQDSFLHLLTRAAIAAIGPRRMPGDYALPVGMSLETKPTPMRPL
jgi:hypothetical protein